MPSKKTTTVVFTKQAQKIKDRLNPAFGLKGMLSAALLLFDELPDDQKISRVADAISIDKQQRGITLADFTLYAHGELSKEKYDELWKLTPKTTQKKFIRLFKEASANFSQLAIEDENAIASASASLKRNRKGRNSSKS